MGIPSITTNLSGFGCFMQDLIERPEDEGCYIVDRRAKSVEDSVTELTDHMMSFCARTRRQRINQRNRVERLSPLLDWKNLGVEYSKARQLSLRRAYPDAFYADGAQDEYFGMEREGYSMSVPASPRFKNTGLATPGDMGTLTEEVGHAPRAAHAHVLMPALRCRPSTRATTTARRGRPARRRRTRTPCASRSRLSPSPRARR
jgi:glycogen(starch) synthase